MRGDATNTPLKEGSFDYALFMFNTLGNLENRELHAFDEDTVHTEEGLRSKRYTLEKLKSLARTAGLYGEIKQLTPISYIAELIKCV